MSWSSYWKKMVNRDIEFIMNNHAQKLMDIPYASKLFGYKWIFKWKIKADGILNKYEAKIVVKCFKQQEEMNYFDTCSPISRINSIRILIAITIINKVEIHQIDAKITFLNSDLDEEI
jgi:hypothetical protein